MQIAALTSWCNPLTWMGPIFDKELRVASRRKRTYWLRAGYVGVMAVFLIPVWAEQLRYSAGSGLATLAASEIGIQISRILLTIQFVSMQILAAFFLCTAIRDEITRRTLGVLWTTPIGGLQLVIGKLAGKMLILIQLLAMSIPILSMLRLFGGIPWSMLIAGLCLTLATMFLVGSLSQLLSLYVRSGFMVVAMTAALLGAAWGPFPILVFFGWALWNNHINMPEWLEFGIITSNPYFSFFDQLDMGTNSSLHICCMVQIGIGALLVWITAAAVRKRGLRSMDELPRRETFRPERYHPKAVFLFRPWFGHTLIKRWFGPGMIWKESISPIFRGRHRMLFLILTAIGIGVGLWTLIVMTVFDMWNIVNMQTQLGIVLSGFVLGVLLTVITSVTVITGEIEGQSWPILLATPLSGAGILDGKVYGVLRRSGWVWAALVFWGLISCWQKTLQWKTVLEWIPLIFLTVGFVICLGFYLAIRYTRAMPAITICLAVLLILWVFLPFLMGYLENLSAAVTYWVHSSDSLFVGVIETIFGSFMVFDTILSGICEGVQCCNPVFFLFFSLIHDGMEYSVYDLYQANHLMVYIFSTIVLYAVLGSLFYWKARKLMRKRVFA